MLIEDGILESLIQDGRTIELIQSYLQNCCNIAIDLENLKQHIITLYDKKLLKVAYPIQYANVPSLQDDLFKDYWFDLSSSGEKECIKRNLMISQEKNIDN